MSLVCKDFYGREISLNDYVIAIRGPDKAKGVEGYVTDMREYEGCGILLEISTPGGRIVDSYARPGDYEKTR